MSPELPLEVSASGEQLTKDAEYGVRLTFVCHIDGLAYENVKGYHSFARDDRLYATSPELDEPMSKERLRIIETGSRKAHAPAPAIQ